MNERTSEQTYNKPKKGARRKNCSLLHSLDLFFPLSTHFYAYLCCMCIRRIKSNAILHCTQFHSKTSLSFWLNSTEKQKRRRKTFEQNIMKIDPFEVQRFHPINDKMRSFQPICALFLPAGGQFIHCAFSFKSSNLFANSRLIKKRCKFEEKGNTAYSFRRASCIKQHQKGMEKSCLFLPAIGCQAAKMLNRWMRMRAVIYASGMSSTMKLVDIVKGRRMTVL